MFTLPTPRLGVTKVSTVEVKLTICQILVPKEKYPIVSLKLMNVETCGSLLKTQKSAVSKMSLIQPKEFRTWETGLFKMPHLETPCFQTAFKVTNRQI